MAELTYVRTPGRIAKLFRGYSELKISERIERTMYFYYATLMAFGALLWVAFMVIAGEYTKALIPLAGFVATLSTFFLCSIRRNIQWGWTVQIFIGIVLPFVLQYLLGGIVNSGAVMTWSLVALLGSISFQRPKELAAWVTLFTVMCIHAFYMEGTVFVKIARNLPIVTTCINFLVVASVIFTLCHFFIRMQEDLQQTFAKKRLELRESRDKIHRNLMMAKQFQDILHSHAHKSKAFSDMLIFKRSESHVNGNFHWQGDFMQNHVVVFVENPHEGIRGSMEAMMLWNMIDNSVSRSEVQAPHNLIEFVQRDLYSKYDIPQIREIMTEVKMTVLCHDVLRNEIQFASTGSTLVVNEGGKVEVHCGFDKESGEHVTAPNGDKINIGRFKPVGSSKILFLNEAMLEVLGLEDNQALGKEDGTLSSMFEWDFEIAEKELANVLKRSDSDKDLFLLGLQV